MNETWADVPSWEGYYYVSNQGNIKNAKWKTLKKKIDNGYYRVCLTHKDRKEFVSVHRLVLSVFGKRQKDKPYVNHKNGIKTDNRVENLEWCTYSENEIHKHRVLGVPYNAPMRGLFGKNNPFSKPVLQIKDGIVIANFEGTKDVERKLGFCNVSISKCCNGKQKTAYGYNWKYKQKDVK